MKFDMTPDQAAHVVARISEETGGAYGVTPGVRYNEGALFVPDADGEAVARIIAEPGYADATLAALKAQARARVLTLADAMARRVTARYPEIEVASWPTQAAEARAVKAGATEAPLLSRLASKWGMPLDRLADAVLAKAADYTDLTAAIIDMRDGATAAIDAASDAATINAAWQGALAETEKRMAALP